MQRAVRMGENIRRAGEEFQAGDEVLPAGVRVTPPVVGLLAALGLTSAHVRRKPRVALVVTGSELALPGEPLRPGQIYDANSHALQAALASGGIDRCAVYHAVDDPGILQDRLREALHAAEVVLTIGGVSVGDYDFVKDAGAALGITTHFWSVAIKPAKPTYFGTLGSGRQKRYLFGLPGNPVSALVAYYYFVRPSLRQLMGQPADDTLSLYAELGSDLKKKAGREELVRGIASLEGDRLLVQSAEGQESHMLGGLSQANCIIRFPLELERLAAGSRVRIDLLEW
jgi:molybdopterin molybdotransferase